MIGGPPEGRAPVSWRGGDQRGVISARFRARRALQLRDHIIGQSRMASGQLAAELLQLVAGELQFVGASLRMGNDIVPADLFGA